MNPQLVASVIVALLAIGWIVGEVKNIRALRIPGAIAVVAIAPLAYQIGVVIGHGRAYVRARSATDQFLTSCLFDLEHGGNAHVITALKRAHAIADEPEKSAGSFFIELPTLSANDLPDSK